MFCWLSDRIWKACNECLLIMNSIPQYAACCKISSIKCNIVQEYPADKLPWGCLYNEVKVYTCTYSSRMNIHLPWLTEQIMGKQIENIEDKTRWRKGLYSTKKTWQFPTINFNLKFENLQYLRWLDFYTTSIAWKKFSHLCQRLQL